jgi:hypothetical protein
VLANLIKVSAQVLKPSDEINDNVASFVAHKIILRTDKPVIISPDLTF